MINALYSDLDALALPAPLVGRTFPFAELPQALEHLQGGGSVGKVVVLVGGEDGEA